MSSNSDQPVQMADNVPTTSPADSALQSDQSLSSPAPSHSHRRNNERERAPSPPERSPQPEPVPDSAPLSAGPAPEPAPAAAAFTPTPSPEPISSSSSSASGSNFVPHYTRAQGLSRSPSAPPRPVLTFKHEELGRFDVSRVLDYATTDLSTLRGKGAWGFVYEGLHNETGQAVAIKIILLDAYDDGEGEECVRNEIRCHQKASRLVNGDVNPYVLPILDSFIDLENRFGCIITPYIEDGTLSALMSQFVGVGMPNAAAHDMIMKLIVGIVGMHDSGVIHLDLKGGNILVRRNLETDAYDPLIADFGLAALTSKEDRARGDIRWMMRGWGTLPYQAPDRRSEGLVPGNYTVVHARKSDAYALGVIAGVIFGGFAGTEKVKRTWNPRKDRARTLDRVGNPENAKLINNLLNTSVSTRMSLQDFVKKAWRLPLEVPVNEDEQPAVDAQVTNEEPAADAMAPGADVIGAVVFDEEPADEKEKPVIQADVIGTAVIDTEVDQVQSAEVQQQEIKEEEVQSQVVRGCSRSHKRPREDDPEEAVNPGDEEHDVLGDASPSPFKRQRRGRKGKKPDISTRNLRPRP